MPRCWPAPWAGRNWGQVGAACCRLTSQVTRQPHNQSDWYSITGATNPSARKIAIHHPWLRHVGRYLPINADPESNLDSGRPRCCLHAKNPPWRKKSMRPRPIPPVGTECSKQARESVLERFLQRRRPDIEWPAVLRCGSDSPKPAYLWCHGRAGPCCRAPLGHLAGRYPAAGATRLATLGLPTDLFPLENVVPQRGEVLFYFRPKERIVLRENLRLQLSEISLAQEVFR